MFRVLPKVVGERTANALERRRMAVLLAALLLLILASPLADLAGGSRLVIVGATAAFLLSCLQQADPYSQFRLPARLMVLLWLLLNLPVLRAERAWVTGVASLILAALNIGVLWLVAKHMIQAKQIDAELLCSAVGAYLLLGAFWAQTYVLIDLAAPAAFSQAGTDGTNQGALFYFSFITLTTTGFGDVTAVSPPVRMWAVLEAIVGTMYNAIVIARLVSLYGSNLRHKE